MSKLDSKYRNQTEERPTPYTYECENCEREEDIYFSMKDDRPDRYDCPFCNRPNSMKRVFGNTSTHIPMDWGSTDNDFDFSKSPSKRKHFW
jgi:predicted nucleic acid-binding Zn ribbon protein